jgi:hypothetical protein
MKKPPLRNPGLAFKRRAIAARRVGVGARCACGEDRPLALIPQSRPVICIKCDRRKKGFKTMDNHHPFSKTNDLTTTVPIPVNDHRADLNEAQNDWPKRTLENPDGSPVLAGAARIRGFIDTICYLIEKGLLWVADMLEQFDEWARLQLSPKYWVGTPLEAFCPKP